MVIVAVSGGPDSMALLDCLRQSQMECIVAHVNYHFRQDSDLDEKIVSDYCAKYHLKLCVLHHRGDFEGNFEATARDFRYRFFKELADVYHTNCLYVGHHQDDVLETILMQKERKSAVSYLGIQSISQIYDLWVYRPFLSFTKEELILYCQLNHIPYRHDYTNFDCQYKRNFYRYKLSKMTLERKHALLEDAKAYNTRKRQHLLNAKQLFDAQFDGKWLNITGLSEMNRYIVLDYYLRDYLKLNSKRISSQLLKECLKMITSNKKEAKTTLFEGFILYRLGQLIQVRKNESINSYCFIYDGTKLLETTYFKMANEGHQNEGICLKEGDLPLIIRNFRKGDKMQLSYGTKKISRLFIDAKISKEDRMKWPIVLNSHQEIILVPKIAKNKDYLMEKPSLFVLQ